MIKIGDETIPLTDAGNAQLFAHEHGADLRWVPQWGTWLRYDGKRWARTPGESLVPLAIQTARGFYRRAAEERNDDMRKILAAHAKSMESASRLEAMIKLARGLLVANADTFDRDPFVLNVDNGTIDLRGEVRVHARGDMLTKLAPVAWDPSVACPMWDAFLARVLPDEGVRSWVQRYAGYCLTADVGEQVLAFFHGRGANGKSTLVEILMHVLGDYAKAGAPDLLLAKRGESHPTELADLQGARLVTCQETEAGRQWAESLVKRITGGDTIKARLMRCDFFSFAPSHKLIVSANHKPKVRGQDEGIWRRIRLVPFDVTIPEAERDDALPAKLRAEAPGILRWMVAGCLAWQREGLGVPAAIAAATRDYRHEQDALGTFIEDRCAIEPGAFAAYDDLYNAYRAWTIATGGATWQRETLIEALEERGFAKRKGAKGKRGIDGLKVRVAQVAEVAQFPG
jgi:putative DNA primase/helicase